MLKIDVQPKVGWDGDLMIELLPYMEEAATSFLGKDVGAINIVESQKPARGEAKRRVRVSLGPADHVSLDRIRRAAGAAARWLAGHEIPQAAIDLQIIDALGLDGAHAALCEGLLLGDFRFDRYQSKKSTLPDAVTTLLTNGGADRLEETVREAQAVIEAVNLARAWAHEPPNVLNPATLATWTQELASQSGLACKVLDEKDLMKLGAGAILAVGGGSSVPPRLIILEWPGKPKRADGKPVILVGKAITFDTGGYTIKTRAGLIGSKFDKCGGMAVIGALKAAAALELERPVVGIIAAAENAISQGAYRPNDIITTLSGKTVEVISTDAEGRLILADALTFAQRNYAPSALIDIATLTGGVITALGSVRAGMMSNDDKLAQKLIEAGQRTHERLWRLPLDDDYAKQIKGAESDIKNSGGTQATPVIGGIFLKQFVDDGVPWAHIDIAGVSTTGRDQPGPPKQATGFGVRLLVSLLMNDEV